jgi:ribonuclease P protein component
MPRDKKRCLTRASQFGQVYSWGSSWAVPYLAVRALPNHLDFYRCGIVVSKKIGGAVVRNRVRRRLREIIRAAAIKPGWDIIFVARPGIVKGEFAGIKAATVGILTRGGLLSEDYEGPCPGND